VNPSQLVSDLDRQAGEARQQLPALRAEMARRQQDSVRLYEPMPAQDAFHRSRATVRIIRKGNRAGGTYACCQEVARAVRRCDPHGKYPTDRPLIVWIIVFVQENIGRTLFRMLFTPGAGAEVFLIRDLETNDFRVWRPNDPGDAARKDERIMAPPLIPSEVVEGGEVGMNPGEPAGFSWVEKGPRIFKVCRLKNGSEIRTFCSNSEPPMGDPVDVVVIDEDLKQDRRIISELMARISTRGGKIIWAVWPKDKNEALHKLCREAEDQQGMENPDVEEFRMRFDANIYTPAALREQTLRLWATQGEAIVRSRNEGDFMLDSVLMYPEFEMDVHGVPNVGDPKCLERSQYWENIDWFLRDRKIPKDWTRFLWLDPGWGTIAVLFLAVPPPSLGDYVVAYDEVYLHGHTVPRVADAIAEKVLGQRFHLFGIDWHQARKHTQASTKNYGQQFTEEFRKRGIASHLTGNSFRKGSDDVDGRAAAVRTWLGQRAVGAPKFRVLRSKVHDRRSACPNLEDEFELYRRHVDDRPIKEHDHLMNCLEYAAHDRLTGYHRLPGAPLPEDPVVAEFKRWRGAIEGSRGEGVHLGMAAGSSQGTRPFH